MNWIQKLASASGGRPLISLAFSSAHLTPRTPCKRFRANGHFCIPRSVSDSNGKCHQSVSSSTTRHATPSLFEDQILAVCSFACSLPCFHVREHEMRLWRGDEMRRRRARTESRRLSFSTGVCTDPAGGTPASGEVMIHKGFMWESERAIRKISRDVKKTGGESVSVREISSMGSDASARYSEVHKDLIPCDSFSASSLTVSEIVPSTPWIHVQMIAGKRESKSRWICMLTKSVSRPDARCSDCCCGLLSPPLFSLQNPTRTARRHPIEQSNGERLLVT